MSDSSGAERRGVTLAVLACAVAFPFLASGYHLYQGAQVLILAIALLGLNLLTGFNGQISLGHGAFFAIGGYGVAILSAKLGLPYWAAIPIASLVCFVAGFLFGFPALRFGGSTGGQREHSTRAGSSDRRSDQQHAATHCAAGARSLRRRLAQR